MLDGATYSAKFDLIFVCETWLDNSVSDGLLLYSNSNYNLLRCDRATRGGGVCAFIDKNVPYIAVALPREYADVELLCFDVVRADWKHRFMVAYRPPQLDLLFTNNLINCLDRLCAIDYGFTICGDFNMPRINWAEGYDVSLLPQLEACLVTFIVDNGLLQLITQPTRLNNTLDLLITNDPLAVHNVAVNTPFSTSDHNAIAWQAWFPRTARETATLRRDFRRADYAALNMHLSGIDWVHLFASAAPNDVNSVWQIFKRVIGYACCLYVPLRHISARRGAKHCYPLHIRRALKRKCYLWRHRHNAGGLARYDAQARRCKRLIQHHHHNKEQRLLNSNSVAAFYRHVNSKLCSSQRIAPIRAHDQVLTDDYSKAQAFNKFFTSVFTNSSLNDATTEQTPPLIPGNIVFTPTVTYDALRSAKRKFSSGPDAIPSAFWINVAASVALPVSVIFTLSYTFSKLPNDWKCASVVPLFKKGDPSLVNNYRPISLTCTLCKIMETIINKSLLHFASTRGLITNSQHGFLPNRSTCTQLLECHNDWCSSLDNSHPVDVIFIDFSKAFDVVSHAKLVSKLKSIGIPSLTLSWIKAFLTNRCQAVNINGTSSAQSAVTSGVIQGSVLGPVLFMLYINDLPAACPDCTVKLFADDVKVYKEIRAARDRIALQRSLTALCEWARCWELVLSIDKCLYLQLGYRDISFTYTLNAHLLQPCSSARDLGVAVQYNLKPGLYCTEIALKANTRCKLILKSFLARNPQNLARAFITYVRPLIEYCTPVWCPHNKCDIETIENVQRNFTRQVFRYCHLEPSTYNERLNFLGLQRLELRRIHFDLVFMFKLTHGMVNTELQHALRFAAHPGTRGHRYKLFITRSHKLVLSSYFINRIAPIWNMLPDDCFNVESLSVFKRKIHAVDITVYLKGRS